MTGSNSDPPEPGLDLQGGAGPDSNGGKNEGGEAGSIQLKQFLAELDAIGLGLRQRSGEGDEGIGGAESQVLQLLDEHTQLTVPQLARLRGTSRQNIQIVINRLVAEGCAAFNGNPAHKRSALVELTESGRARLRLASLQQERFEAELAANLSDAELRSGLELMHRLKQVLTNKEPKPMAAPKPDKIKRPTAWHQKPQPPSQAEEIADDAAPTSAPGLSEEPTDYGLPSNLL